MLVFLSHYDDVIMTMLASQITSLTVVYSTVYSGVNQRKHQSSASLAFVREIHRGPVNFPHKWPVTRKMFPFDDVIMIQTRRSYASLTYMMEIPAPLRRHHCIERDSSNLMTNRVHSPQYTHGVCCVYFCCTTYYEFLGNSS